MTNLGEPITLAAAAPFELGLSLRALAGFRPAAGDAQLGADRVHQAFSLADGHPVVAEVAPAAGGVVLRGHGPRGERDRAELATAVSRWLSLDDDPAPFLASARADPAMAPVLAETEGLHQVRSTGLAEGGCYFVLAQRTSQAVAGFRKRRLASAFGPPPLEHGGVSHQAFPSLDRLAGCSVGELAPFTANQRQAEYLAAVVQRLAEWPPGWGYQVSTEELLGELRTIRGVGEFTASAIALRVLGRLDVVPAMLPTFTRAIETLYGPGASLAELQAHYGTQVGLWGYHVRTGLAWLGDAEAGAVRSARAGPSARTPQLRHRAR
jgi:DNA-3-methyladenine glycosylase II